MNPKILILTKYASLGGSSRYRFYQYLPYLQSQGFEISISSLLDNKYIADLNKSNISVETRNRKRNLSNLLNVYFQRVRKLINSNGHDLLWIEKELLPYAPAWLEKILIGDIPYVVDYDDAQFHVYDYYGSKSTKLFLSNKIDNIMANSKLVVAGNKYIEERANAAGAKRIEIIPTVVDINRYSVENNSINKVNLTELLDKELSQKQSSQIFNIGWIGSPSTSRYINPMQPVFQQLNEKYNCKFTLIGAGNFQLEGISLTLKNWNEESEVEDLKILDVGIMPLDNNLWEQGKCGIKLIQYMACGLPVVGTPIGVNKDIIQHGFNGFHANSPDDWVKYLSILAEDPQLRSVMGKRGRSMVESTYCLHLTAPKLAQLLRSCL
jgi:glycosyltransferase involved in cell wall biosynthesis